MCNHNLRWHFNLYATVKVFQKLTMGGAGTCSGQGIPQTVFWQHWSTSNSVLDVSPLMTSAHSAVVLGSLKHWPRVDTALDKRMTTVVVMRCIVLCYGLCCPPTCTASPCHHYFFEGVHHVIWFENILDLSFPAFTCLCLWERECGWIDTSAVAIWCLFLRWIWTKRESTSLSLMGRCYI